jgi:hypothetical protein
MRGGSRASFSLNEQAVKIATQLTSVSLAVESRRVPPADAIPPAPVSVGIVQFTEKSDEGRKECKRERAATDLLMNHSPLVFHLVYGPRTWHAELVNIDDDSLGTPFFEDDAKGYRIWLPQSAHNGFLFQAAVV